MLSLPVSVASLTENSEHCAGSASYNGFDSGLTESPSMVMYGFNGGAHVYCGFQGNQNRNMVAVASGVKSGVSLNFGFSYFTS